MASGFSDTSKMTAVAPRCTALFACKHRPQWSFSWFNVASLYQLSFSQALTFHMKATGGRCLPTQTTERATWRENYQRREQGTDHFNSISLMVKREWEPSLRRHYTFSTIPSVQLRVMQDAAHTQGSWKTLSRVSNCWKLELLSSESRESRSTEVFWRLLLKAKDEGNAWICRSRGISSQNPNWLPIVKKKKVLYLNSCLSLQPILTLLDSQCPI